MPKYKAGDCIYRIYKNSTFLFFFKEVKINRYIYDIYFLKGKKEYKDNPIYNHNCEARFVDESPDCHYKNYLVNPKIAKVLYGTV